MPPAEYSDLIRRLPRTFASAVNGQFAQWDMLFPAEQRVLRAQLDVMGALPPASFERLFRPILELEARMDLPRANPAGMSIQETGVLARSPLYPRWRTEVERVFAEINQQVAAPRRPRLVVLSLPAGAQKKDGLWPELAKRGAWTALDEPFEALVRTLANAAPARVESAWAIECEPVIAHWGGARVVSISWSGIARVRREFLSRLNTIQRDLHSADATTAELRRSDLSTLLGPGIQPRVREFVREILLSGNGSLVFNNSFVEWASAEALRRAQPDVLFAGFGFREKLKPFSSTVLFEDQNRSNPTRAELDPAGSLVDAEMLAGYVYYAAEGLDAYRGRTLYFLGQNGVNRVLIFAPKAAAPSAKPAAWALEWLSSPSVE